jgi:hypothetical protein
MVLETVIMWYREPVFDNFKFKHRNPSVRMEYINSKTLQDKPDILMRGYSTANKKITV